MITQEGQSVKSIAERHFGERYTVIENEKGSYAIVSQKNKDFKALFADVSFLLVDLRNGQIVWEDELSNGKVSWVQNFIIEARSNKKTKERGYQKRSYQLDVRTGKKTKESSESNY